MGRTCGLGYGCHVAALLPATGTVSLTYNGTAWATVSLSSGSGTATWPATPTVGTYAIVATYNGDSNNTTATATASMTVLQATPLVTWNTPADIVSGTALGSSQLNASHAVAGSLTYSPAAGTVLTTGDHTLTATFTPTDTTDYATTTVSTYITVTSAASTWDTGTVTLTVNSSPVSTATYGSTSTPSSVAEALAANVVANSPVSVIAVDDVIYLQATTAGLGSDYSYTLSAVSNNPSVFTPPSFASPTVSGNLDGGAAQGANSGVTVYKYCVPGPLNPNCTASTNGYDPVGNLLSYTDSVTGTWSMASDTGASGYDSLNRLSLATQTPPTGAPQSFCWTYDAFGNRTTQASSNQMFTNAAGAVTCALAGSANLLSNSWANFNTNNQFTATTQATGGVPYDAAGNILNDGVNQYLYDGDGRICAVRSEPVPGTYAMTGYVYDANGTRVAKGAITAWSCDPGVNGFKTTNDYILGLSGEQFTEMAMDANNVMAWQHTNVYAAGSLIATYDNDGLHFYLNDPLGSRRSQTDFAGVLEQTCASLPYGDGLNCTGSTQTPTEHHFTGKERDAESGNDYFGARYYASSMGRFLSPDWSAKQDPVPYARLDNPQTLNLYAYLRNNPLAGVDADGHCPPGQDCSKVQVTVTVEQKPKFTKNVPLKDKDGNVVKGPNGKPVEKDTGIHGTLAGTVTVNGTPAAGVKLTESNAETTEIDGTKTNPPIREGEGTSPNGKYNDDIGYGFATSGKADNANIINQLSTEKLTITDTQTLTMAFPSGGTCSATSTRILTNVGSDGNASSHYTLTTTQPIVTPNQ